MKKLILFVMLFSLLLPLCGCRSSDSDDLKIQKEEIQLVDVQSSWFEGLSFISGIPLKFAFEEDTTDAETITFQLQVNCGEFLGDYLLDKYKENPDDPVGSIELYNLGKNCVIDNGEKVEWRYLGHDFNKIVEDEGGVYVDAIMMSGSNIVGYAVLSIQKGSTWYSAKCLESVYYPKVNGDYQAITEEYVRQQMEQCKS